MEGSDFWWIRSLLIVSLGVNTRRMSHYWPLTNVPPPASSLAGRLSLTPQPQPWPWQWLSSILYITIIILLGWGNLDISTKPTFWRKSCFILYLLSELPSLQFVSDMKNWLESTLRWIDFYDCQYDFFLLFQQATLIRPSNTCLTSSFWCQP